MLISPDWGKLVTVFFHCWFRIRRCSNIEIIKTKLNYKVRTRNKITITKKVEITKTEVFNIHILLCFDMFYLQLNMSGKNGQTKKNEARLLFSDNFINKERNQTGNTVVRSPIEQNFGCCSVVWYRMLIICTCERSIQCK